jgi:hypothetical protein
VAAAGGQRGRISVAAPKIMIATPAYGEVFYTPYVSSMLSLTRALQKRGIDFAFNAISYSEIAESRNFLLTHWYDKTDASHLLFVDADMGFPAALITEMVDFDKPLVGAVYPKRTLDVKKVAQLAAEEKEPARAITRAQDFVLRPLRGARPATGRPGFIQVEACGSGILLIARGCIDAMLKAMPRLADTKAKTTSPLAKNLDRLIRAFDVLYVNGMRLSEDFSFCYRWRHGCKGEVWANIAHEIVHIGLQRFGGTYLEKISGSGQIVVRRGESTVVTGRLTPRPPVKH